MKYLQLCGIIYINLTNNAEGKKPAPNKDIQFYSMYIMYKNWIK